jgi:hypothetical protein
MVRLGTRPQAQSTASEHRRKGRRGVANAEAGVNPVGERLAAPASRGRSCRGRRLRESLRDAVHLLRSEGGLAAAFCRLGKHQAAAAEQAMNVPGTQRDAKALLDPLRDAPLRPDCAGQSHGVRRLSERFAQLGPLRRAQAIASPAAPQQHRDSPVSKHLSDGAHAVGDPEAAVNGADEGLPAPVILCNARFARGSAEEAAQLVRLPGGQTSGVPLKFHRRLHLAQHPADVLHRKLNVKPCLDEPAHERACPTWPVHAGRRRWSGQQPLQPSLPGSAQAGLTGGPQGQGNALGSERSDRVGVAPREPDTPDQAADPCPGPTICGNARLPRGPGQQTLQLLPSAG